MKKFCTAAVVCFAVTYFFNGQYYGAFFGMARQIYHHAR
jgi:hypothetical protein